MISTVMMELSDYHVLSLQTCAEALREANVAAAFGKPINF